MMTQQDPSHNHLISSPNFGLAMTDVVDWRMPRPPLPFRLMAPDMRVLDVLGHRGVPPVRVVVCAEPPLGAARWTVRFITEQVLKHTLVAQVGRDTIRARLYRHDLKPWRGKHMWGIADLDAAYIACRDAVLTLSERPYSVREPVVCLDEKRCPCMPRGGPRDRRGGPANISAWSSPTRDGTSPAPRGIARRPRWLAWCGPWCTCIRGPGPFISSSHPQPHREQALTDHVGARAPSSVATTHGARHAAPRALAESSGDRVASGVTAASRTRRLDALATLQRHTRAWTTRANRRRTTIGSPFTRHDARRKFGSAHPLSCRSKT